MQHDDLPYVYMMNDNHNEVTNRFYFLKKICSKTLWLWFEPLTRRLEICGRSWAFWIFLKSLFFHFDKILCRPSYTLFHSWLFPFLLYLLKKIILLCNWKQFLLNLLRTNIPFLAVYIYICYCLHVLIFRRVDD